MSARPMNTDDEWVAGDRFQFTHRFTLPANEVFVRAGSTHGKSLPRPNIASLLARAERAILAREKALARFKAACALSLMGLDFVLLKGLRERRVDRCARLVRESYAEIAALVDGWKDLYAQVSGGSR